MHARWLGHPTLGSCTVSTTWKPQSFVQVGTSFGTSASAATSTGATVTPGYGAGQNQADPTGPAGGTLVGNQMTPGSSGGQSFGSAGYGQAVGS